MLYPTELRALVKYQGLATVACQPGANVPRNRTRLNGEQKNSVLRCMKISGKPAKGAWETTQYQKLFRYVASGTIFARFKIRGKQVRQSYLKPQSSCRHGN